MQAKGVGLAGDSPTNILPGHTPVSEVSHMCRPQGMGTVRLVTSTCPLRRHGRITVTLSDTRMLWTGRFAHGRCDGRGTDSTVTGRNEWFPSVIVCRLDSMVSGVFLNQFPRVLSNVDDTFVVVAPL